jgi:hypothetical protein
VDENIIALGKVPATSEGLRDALFDEINALRAGTTTVQRAKTIAMLAARIIESVRAQVQVQKLLTDGGKDVSLGSSKAVTKPAAR